MKVSYAVVVLALFPTSCMNANLALAAVNDSALSRIHSVENNFPAATKDGKTIKLSLQEWMRAFAIPGVSIAVIHDYKISWVKAYGVLEAGKDNSLVTTKTPFQAASISKPVTALAALHYVDHGRLNLDENINKYFHAWKLPASNATTKVTLRNLLAHTSGVTAGGFTGYERDAPLPNVIQILNGGAPANNQPASQTGQADDAVNYSGLGYSMVQLALMDQLHKPFNEIVANSVFKPIGMKDSTFEQKLADAIAATVARGHQSSGAVLTNGWFVNPELAAAGLWTTPSDLALLAIEVAKSKQGKSNRILSKKMTQLMLTPHKDQMGLGFVVRPGDTHGYFSHSGGNRGYRAHVEMIADAGYGVVIMTNSDGGVPFISLLTRSVAESYQWPATHRPLNAAQIDAVFVQLDHNKNIRRKISVADDVLMRYVGRYELAPGFEFDIQPAKNHLLVKLGDQPRFPAYPESDSKFFFEIVDAQISFLQNDAGEATSLVLHQGGRDQPAKKIK